MLPLLGSRLGSKGVSVNLQHTHRNLKHIMTKKQGALRSQLQKPIRLSKRKELGGLRVG